MPRKRRPQPPPPTPQEVTKAFARNVAWLAKFDPVLPRHLLQIGWHVEHLGQRVAAAEMVRWQAVLEQLDTGDFRMTPQAEAWIAEAGEAIIPPERLDEQVAA